MNARVIRLILYIRVSRVMGRDKEVDSFQSPDMQREACENYVKTVPGAKIVKVITDLDKSGKDMEREGMAEALAMIEAGQADGIIVAKLDRFARTTAAIEVIESMVAEGKTFLSVAEKFDTTTPMGMFALGLMLLVAKLERDKHVENWRDIMHRKVKMQGVVIRPPYGYRRSAGKGSPVEPDENAHVVTRIFKERAGGMSFGKIAWGLTNDGIPAPRSARWTGSTVRGVVLSRTYLGEASYGGHVKEDAHKELIDPITWEAAQPTMTRGPRASSKHPLVGLVFCASCGYAMSYGSVMNRGVRLTRLVCKVHHSSGSCSAPCTANADNLEAHVFAAFLDRYGEAAVEGAQAGDPSVREEAEAARLELTTWLTDTRMRSLLKPADYEAGTDARVRRVEIAEEAEAEQVRNDAAGALRVSETFWQDATVEERQHLLRVGIHAIVIDRAEHRRSPVSDRTTIHWTGESDFERPHTWRRA